MESNKTEAKKSTIADKIKGIDFVKIGKRAAMGAGIGLAVGAAFYAGKKLGANPTDVVETVTDTVKDAMPAVAETVETAAEIVA